MNNCIPFMVLVTLFSAVLAGAQVVPPPGHDRDWDQGYGAGFGDAITAAARLGPPAWPADVTYKPDATYHIAPTGSDKLSDGSVARPFATIGRALQQIHNDRAGASPPKLAEISYRADGTYLQNQIITENGLLIDSYGATNLEQRPKINSDYTPFLWLKASDVHLQNLRLAGTVAANTNPEGSFGIYCNGGDNITLDYCEIDGFQMNIVLISGATHVRLYHNFIANSWTPKAQTMSCSGLYTECVSPDVQCNIFYHNGWRAPFDVKNAAMVQAMMFRHGWYENPGSNAVGGTDKFNLYLRNACTGHQCRAGGSDTEWCVFWDNGNACDLLTTGGESNTLGGQVGHCAFFGNLTRDFVSNGGGVLGQSAADDFHDLLFAGGAQSMQLPPAIMIGWKNAAPATITGTFTYCRGIWPTTDVMLLSGRTAMQTGVAIRKPNATEHVPTLLDFLGTKDDVSTAALLRKNLHNPKFSAQTVVGWLTRSLPN
jgi:hypothetical protein